MWWESGGHERVLIGRLLYEVERDYWRYEPVRWAVLAGALGLDVQVLPDRLRLAQSDPRLQRIKRSLGTGCVFVEAPA